MLYLLFEPIPYSGFSWLLTRLMIPLDDFKTSLPSSGESDNEWIDTAFSPQTRSTTSVLPRPLKPLRSMLRELKGLSREGLSSNIIINAPFTPAPGALTPDD